MSEKEKDLIKALAALPQAQQEKAAYVLQGALLGYQMAQEEQEQKEAMPCGA